MTAINAESLARVYPADPPVVALAGVDLTVDRGERVAIVGRSGAGKSTLLNLLGLLDRPTSGKFQLLDRETVDLASAERDELRARHIGFVFQDSHVLGHRTVSENLDIKLAVLAMPRAHRPEATREVLERVGLSHRSNAPARLLSGGERQRLAVARAVVGQPALLLADEPTGNLDEYNSSTVLSMFDEQAATGVAVVVITHDMRLAAWADRTLELSSGALAPAPAERIGA
jgi:putative ABC transport system ATP-binding protein